MEGFDTTCMVGGKTRLLSHCNSNDWDVTSQQRVSWDALSQSKILKSPGDESEQKKKQTFK